MRPLGVFSASGVLLLSSIASAAETKKGMPQLDFSNPLTISQVVWLAIIFLTLYLLLSKWALPQVAEVLDARAGRIAGDLDAARGAKAAADEAIMELTAATHSAQAAARTEIANAVASAKEAATAQAVVLNARLETQLASAETQIAAARAAAVGALRQVASETTSVVVARLTGISASQQAVDAAVGAVLASRGQS